MFNPQEYVHKINNEEHGAARLAHITEAIQEADNAGQAYWRLYFRYEYIEESVFYGDNFKGLLCFPEYLKIFDEHPEQEDEMSQDMMWAFKWLLGDVDDYYQISLEQVENYFSEFKQRCQKYGFSLRTYYMKQTSFWLEVDLPRALENFEKFKKFSRNRNSDCIACEINFEMEVLLRQHKEKEALSVAEPILTHRKSCAEIPHLTYATLAEYYFSEGNFTEAEYYADLCKNLIFGKPEFLKELGMLMEIYSRINPPEAWNLLKYHVNFFMKCNNPKMKMTFARGAFRVMEVLQQETEFVHSSRMNVLPIKPSEDGWRSEEMKQYFYEQAKEIAEKLDQRNQIPHYVPLLEKDFPEPLSEEKLQEQQHSSVHGLIRKERASFAFFLKNSVSKEEICSRLEKQNISVQDKESYIFFTLEQDSKIMEMAMFKSEGKPDLQENPLLNAPPEMIEEAQQCPEVYLFTTEISGEPLKAYHALMRFVSELFPELCYMLSLSAVKLYPAAMVRYAGKYANFLSPQQLFNLYFSGKEEPDEIMGVTVGLSVFGMRELEFVGAKQDTFQQFAKIIDDVAAYCVANNALPDEGQTIIPCHDIAETESDEDVPIFWENPEKVLKHFPEESIFQQRPEDCVTGILNLHDILPDMKQPKIPNSTERSRKIHLAEETFPLALEAVKHVKVVVQIVIELDESLWGEYDYYNELLWAKLNPDGKTAVLEQEAETLPNLKIGDTVEVDLENLIDWRLVLSEEEIFSPQELWLLDNEQAGDKS